MAPWYRRPGQGERVIASSGTSGHPKPIPWSRQEDSWYIGEKQALFAAWSAGCSRGLVSLAVGHNAGSAAELLERLGLQVRDLGLSSSDVQADQLCAFAPELLYVSPSILSHLVDLMARTGRRPRSVRRVITNGELLLPSVRARFEDFFGIERAALMDTYGSTEIGTISFSCGACGAYHLLNGLYPEPAPAGFSDAFRVAGVGASALVVSSVKRTTFPVVRFVTYDVVQGLRRDVCTGRSRFTFDRILGRCDDVLTYGELFSPYPLADIIARRLPTARWFAFNPANDLSVVIEGSEPEGFLDDLRALYPTHARLNDLGLIDPPDITFVRNFDEFVARAGLPATRAGKDVRHVVRQALDPAWIPEARP
ncbi:MAG TPA: AMP-binding protein [Kineosporiaceae bacterium]